MQRQLDVADRMREIQPNFRICIACSLAQRLHI